MTEKRISTNSSGDKELLDGNPRIAISYRANDLFHAEGAIAVNAPAETIWNLLTDYNNLSTIIPKVIDSRLIEDNGSHKIIDQTGKSGILFIEKSVRIVLKVTEKFPNALLFEMVEGDFSTYTGSWSFRPGSSREQTFVSWQTDFKPTFFAPPFLVSFLQHQDLPVVMKAIKALAESRYHKNKESNS
ncbi:cyclase/dehydrase [Prosthecochloris aestuarii DSM 271]|uniref:Cyclase/dehydrase n=1 Tax=Prosthecochloris aestuarii (strain DSM 271 / SK 413) TaxID=290512 RepID=B4S6H8_PROA2|nr:SRPBCC family protein [Prosthecochloris aestuarii]ACF45733.1 cyclase/dehydrase [Prosthecochloris aestuarii DSM 271]